MLPIVSLTLAAFPLEQLPCPHTIDQLAFLYPYVFPSGNRNAASHRWATLILKCASELSHDEMAYLFKGFCPVSGSPTGGADTQRHTYPQSGWGALRHMAADGTAAGGALSHCCEPCVCDAKDFLHVDTKRIVDVNGTEVAHNFVVIGSPCGSVPTLSSGHPNVSFSDPFHGGETASLAEQAPDVVCEGDKLQGATYSERGGVIVGMLHEATGSAPPIDGLEGFCEVREQTGYASGMGLIFRLVAGLNPLSPLPTTGHTWSNVAPPGRTRRQERLDGSAALRPAGI